MDLSKKIMKNREYIHEYSAKFWKIAVYIYRRIKGDTIFFAAEKKNGLFGKLFKFWRRKWRNMNKKVNFHKKIIKSHVCV